MSLRAVIASAKSWLGTVESPPGSNVVPSITDRLAGAEGGFGISYDWWDPGRAIDDLKKSAAAHQTGSGHDAESGAAPGYPGRLLEHGEHGADVRALQKQLNKLGAHLQVDGVYGPQTEAAIRHFQEGSSGLGVDGIVGPKTWAALFDGGHATESRPVTDPVAQFIDAVSKPLPPGIAAPHEGAAPTYPGTMLEHGDTGAEVRAVQKQLNAELGGHDLKVDGQFGPATEAAVLRFQTAHGLATDGEVGPKTWAALFDGGHATESRPVDGPRGAVH